MGVAIGHAHGNYTVLCYCHGCDTFYETDEDLSNMCKDCGGTTFTIVDGHSTDPELTWRDESRDEIESRLDGVEVFQ